MDFIVALVNDLASVLIKYNTVENLSSVAEFLKNVLSSIATILSSVQ